MQLNKAGSLSHARALGGIFGFSAVRGVVVVSGWGKGLGVN
jgi:hypothetical protein